MTGRQLARCTLALALGGLLLRGVEAWRLAWDADEFQYIHTAWLLDQGRLPGRDFVCHHTPLLPALAEPLLFPASTPTALIGKARLISFTLVLVAYAFAAASMTGPLGLRLLPFVLLSWHVAFLRSTVEFRTDVGLLAMLAVSLALLLRALDGRERSWLCALAAGAAAGIGLLFKQDPTVPLQLVLAAGFAMLVPGHLGNSARMAAWFVLGLLACASAALAVGASLGMVGTAWQDLVTRHLPGSEEGRFGALPTAWATLRQNTAFWLLGLMGALDAARCLRQRVPDVRPAALLGGWLAALLSLAVPRYPYRQFLLPLTYWTALLIGTAAQRHVLALRRRPAVLAVALALLLLPPLVPLANDIRRGRETQSSAAARLWALIPPDEPVFCPVQITMTRPDAFGEWFLDPVHVEHYRRLAEVREALQATRCRYVVWDAFFLEPLLRSRLLPGERVLGQPMSWPELSEPERARIARDQQALREYIRAHYRQVTDPPFALWVRDESAR